MAWLCSPATAPCIVTVRRGKGERYRQVPLNAEARDALDAWLDQRTALPGHDGPAQFLSL
jgi:site-specific recombinase XerC